MERSTDINEAEGLLAEAESTINKKLLFLIAFVYLSSYLNSVLQRCVPEKVYRGELGVALILGAIGGEISRHYLHEVEVKNLLYGQSILFKLMFLPPIFYDTIFNNQTNSVSALECICAIFSSLWMSSFIAAISFLCGFLSLLQSIQFGLIISTVDTDQLSSSPLVKRMSIATNSVLMLILQILD